MLKYEDQSMEFVNGSCFKDFRTGQGWRARSGMGGSRGSSPWCMWLVSCKEHIVEVLSHLPSCALASSVGVNFRVLWYCAWQYWCKKY